MRSRSLLQNIQFGSLIIVIVVLSFAYRSARADSHPCLLIGQADIPSLSQRLGNTHLNGDVFSAALEGCIRGERSDAAVIWLMDWGFTTGMVLIALQIPRIISLLK